MKKRVKVIAIISLVLITLASLSVSAFAASKSASLKTGDSIAYSGVVNARQCKFSGSNDKVSARNVYFLAKNNHTLIWLTDVSHDLAPGNSFSNNTTTKYSSSCDWELVLNPKGANKDGCVAKGTITTLS